MSVLCFRCGVCCVRYHVQLSLAEARHIADSMGFTWEAWRERFTDPRWPGEDSLLLRHLNGQCVFVARVSEKLIRCLIQAFKPSPCKEWTADLNQPECREGLAKHWGLGVDPEGELDGPVEKISEFKAFLASLG